MPRRRENKSIKSLAYAVVSHPQSGPDGIQRETSIIESYGEKHFVEACVSAIEMLKSAHLITICGHGRQHIIMCESNEDASIACLSSSRENENRSIRRDMRERLSSITSRAPNPRPARRKPKASADATP